MHREGGWTTWCCGWTAIKRERTSVLRSVPLPLPLYPPYLLKHVVIMYAGDGGGGAGNETAKKSLLSGKVSTISFESLALLPFLSLQTVYRAKFSSITESAVLKAFGSLGHPDWNESRSVDARMELDLRIGCAFTRFQTMTFQVRVIFDWFRFLCTNPQKTIVFHDFRSAMWPYCRVKN